MSSSPQDRPPARAVDAETARRVLALAVYLDGSELSPDDEDAVALARRFDLDSAFVATALGHLRTLKENDQAPLDVRRLLTTLIIRYPLLAALELGILAVCMIAVIPRATVGGTITPEFVVGLAAVPVAVCGLLFALAYRSRSEATALRVGVLGAAIPLAAWIVDSRWVRHEPLIYRWGSFDDIAAATILMFAVTIGATLFGAASSRVYAQDTPLRLVDALIQMSREAPVRHATQLTVLAVSAGLGILFFAESSGASAEAITVVSMIGIFSYAVSICGIAFVHASVSTAVRIAAVATFIFCASFYAILAAAAPSVFRADHIAIAISVVGLTAGTFGVLAVPTVAAALAGKLRNAMDAERAETEADRDSLLAQAFELQERLQHTTVSSVELGRIATEMGVDRQIITSLIVGTDRERRRTIAQRIACFGKAIGHGWMRFPHLTMAIFTLVCGIAAMELREWARFQSGIDLRFGVAVGSAALGLAVYVAVFITSFAAASIRTGLALALTTAVINFGVGRYGGEPVGAIRMASFLIPEWVILAFSFGAFLAVTTFMALLGSGLGYSWRRAKRSAALERGDRDTLLSEFVRVYQALNLNEREITFLIVDVKGSTAMKVDADTMLVEYTFSQYHRYVRERVRDHAGHIHSTAGDGVIAGFQDAQGAWDAAVAIQRDVKLFNSESNELGVEFALRCAIHSGTVAIHGEVHEIAFTKVIDVAAHIEKAAPVGGVLVTESAFAKIRPVEALHATGELIDGYRLYAWVPE